MFQGLPFFDTYIYIAIALVLILGVVAYILVQRRSVRRFRPESVPDRGPAPTVATSLEDLTAFYQISSMIAARKDLFGILESVARESHKCLKANRATIFLMDGKDGILKTLVTMVPDTRDETVGLFEEKEIARKVVKQKRAFLLREPKDFSEFFKYGDRDRKITSLMSFPLSSQGKPIGALSLTLINETRPFNEKDQQILSILGNFASLAIENAYLQDEMNKAVSFRKSYEKYLDDILKQLQNLSEEERRRIEEHIVSLMPPKPEEKFAVEEQGGKKEEAEAGKKETAPEAKNLRKDDRVDGVLRVEFKDDSLGFADDLSSGGVFIRTNNPLDLGEQFILKLHMSDQKEPIDVSCKVVWTNKYGKESKNLRRGMGVKFLNLNPEAQRRVEEFIRTQRDNQANAEGGKSTRGFEGDRRRGKGAG